MNAREKYEYWRDIAHYDLETAQAMHEAGRWIYVVFMCQQAIEKLCKGLHLIFLDDDVPKIHDINGIIAKISDKLTVSIDDDKRLLFAKLSAFYLNNRYPEYKERLSKSINKEEASSILNKSQEAFAWLENLIP